MNVLKNAWYVAAWPDEITADGLLGRTILNEPILMFRKRDGSIAAIGDRCPHRFAPLHLGRHMGDSVQCGYHGLEFGADGRCSRNPHGNGAKPARAAVPVYAVIERHGMLWIWMGKKQADPTLIPSEFAFVADSSRAHVKGRLHVAANYLLLVDNLMDLSHGLYLHAGSLATQEMQQNFHPKTRVEGDVVICEREQPNIEPPPIWVPSLPPDAKRVDFFSNVSWHAPSNVIHPVGCRRVGKPEGVDGGVSSRSAHMFTPETEFTSHYFYSNSRNYGVDSPETDARVRKILEKVFGSEDRPMIEAQQKMIGAADLMDLGPILLPTDKASALVRRRIAELIARERQASVESAAESHTATTG
jgi:phenylpropionate dioxygenase-like ring-hydroxylating dioxygenase large terminal subunit